ncbi:hypothetical protein INT45_002376 [Circinella minor]|uniref:ATP-dependent DNA helicase n=1 Tax=Circinella minor TaxID=1195481 RepID=A0A8H7RU28_9FUNG|nr:hypothetical protein INT45_002376 [Circinella minor]
MENSFDFDDDDDFLAAIEQVEQNQQKETKDNNHESNIIDIDDSFDDFDDDALIHAAETVEKQVAITHKGKERQGQLTNFFTSRSTPLTTSPTRPIATSSTTTTAAHKNSSRSIHDDLLPSRRLEDESPPPAPPPPNMNTPCSHVFEPDTLPTWIYPVNYPIRLYQWNIVKKALFTNTLVALPTGLGKTFIAAVVMYNYYRWFPQSKIVFTAPTRPLVTQQIEACFNICGIPQTDTVELTGNIQQERRRLMWKTKRVFFLTPQILKNDLQARICPGEKIVCLVIDEAHKAQGNYAYAEIVKLMQQRQHHQYRMLALSATPGTNLANVQSVIENLNIANIQIRTEDSMDIQEHSHGKNIQTVVVALDYTAGATGVVPEVARNFRTKFFEPCLSRLTRFQAVYSTNVEQNTPYQILMAQQQFSAHARNFNQAVKSMVHNDFAIAGALSRAYDRLCQHGVGSFLSLIEGTLQEYQDVVDKGKHLSVEKGKLLRNYELKRMIDNLKQQQLQPGFMGHPKLQRLLHIILEHLSNEQENDDSTTNTATRIMIFSQYRSSVDEIVKLLSEHKPLVRCSHFVGQAGAKDGKKGLNQREQQDIITRFKRGDLNVLVSTSIGEEGLDIGEVDLIVCYDSQNSPLRLLQRMGRTGRKRKGRCVMLMTETEERKYRSAKESYNQVQSAISRGGNLEYFKQNPSVLPANYHPVWRKKRFTIGTFITSASSATARKKRKTTAVVNSDGLLTEDAQMEFLSKLDVSTVQEAFDKYWPKRDIIKRAQKYLPMNTKPLIHHRVGHSRRTMQFIQLYNKIEQRILHGVDADIDDYGQEKHEEGQEPEPTVGNILYLPRRNKNTDGITIEARTVVPSSSVTKRKSDVSTRDLDDHDDYNDDTLMISDGKVTEASTTTTNTTTTRNNNVLDLPTNSRKQNTTIMQNKRQKSDISMTDVELPMENNNGLLQRNSSDVSMHESDSLLQQSLSSPLERQIHDKTNRQKNKDNNNSKNNNTGFNLEDDYIPGDSWVEEYDSLLLLENRLDRSASFERPDDPVNNENNHQRKSIGIDEFEDILPPHLQSNNNNDDSFFDDDNNNNNNYRSMDNDKELEHPFPFKQLTKEETEEELSISSSMLNWLMAKPVPTEKAKKKLKERARELKLDAAKDWVRLVFSLPISPMIAADEEPSFDDDLDIDMLDAIDQNVQQQKRATLEKQKESSSVQNEQEPNNDNNSNDNDQQQHEEQLLEEQNSDDMILSPMNSNQIVENSSIHYSVSFKYDHCENEQQKEQQEVSSADNIPNNNDNNEEVLSNNNNNSVMSDVTYYEILENKLDDDNRPDSYGNEDPNDEPIIIPSDPPSQEQNQSPTSTSSELSVINVRTRKRRRPIEFTEDNSSEIMEMLPSSPSISTSPVMRRAIEGHRRRRQRLEEAAHNPFLALEAEKSSDEELMGSGHGNTDDDETGSTHTTENNSFIDDDDAEPTSSQQQAPPDEEIYRMGLLSPDVTLGNNRVGGRRSWFDRFQGDKWIQAGEEEDEEDAIDLDDLGVGDDDDDDDEEDNETEGTGEFENNTSTIQEFTDEIIGQEDSDSDDFV